MADVQSDFWASYLAVVPTLKEFEECKRLYVPLKVREVRHVSSGTRQMRADQFLREVRHPRFMLIGEPGAGKTWILKNFVLETAREAQRDPGGGRIPVYLDLNSWRSSGDATGDDLLKWVADRIYVFLGPAGVGAREETRSALTSHRLLLVFDGFNELNANARERFLASLKGLEELLRKEGARDVDIVIGTRKYGFSDRDFDQYAVVEIMPPDRSTKAEILGRYLQPSAHGGAGSFLNEMDDRMQRLTDNILMLKFYGQASTSLIAQDTTRAELVRQWVAKVLSDGGMNPSEHDRVVNHLTAVASLCLERGQLAVEKEEVILRLRKHFGLTDSEARKSLKDISSAGVLQEKVGDVGRVCFAYPQLMEYFAAQDALRIMGLHPSAAVPLDGSTREEYLRNPWNHEILALAAGLLDHDQVQKLLEILERALDSETYLVVAAMVLSDSPSRELEQEFADAIFDDIDLTAGRLRRRARAMVAVLVIIWVPGFLAVATFFGMFESSVTALLLSAGVVASWYYLVPLALKRAYDRFLVDDTKRSVAVMGAPIKALTVLRSSAVELRLSRFLDRDYWFSSTGLVPSRDIASIANLFLDQVAAMLERAIELSRRDLDTILLEIQRDPRLITYLIDLPEAGFTERDVEILAGVVKDQLIMGQLSTEKLWKDAVRKLGRVALAKADFYDRIVSVLEEVKAAVPEALRTEVMQALVAVTVAPPTLPDRILQRMQGFVRAAGPGLFVAVGTGTGTPLGVAAAFFWGEATDAALWGAVGGFVGLLVALCGGIMVAPGKQKERRERRPTH